MSMKQIGRIIYSYRKIKGLSQEELAGIMGVSPAAVSKWERDLSVPDVEILCKLADYFEVTVDELLGRTQDDLMDVKFDDRTDADRFCVAAEILECCRIARNTGLLAVEEQVKNREGSAYDFLKFAISFLLDAVFQKKIPLADAKEFLLQYAENEKDPQTAKMTAEVITLIFLGENEEMIREILRSFLGRKYAKVFATQDQEKRWRMSREEKIRFYSEFHIDNMQTGNGMSVLEKTEDEKIRKMLRELSDEEFVRAAAGAPAKVRERLFRNLSDRMIWMLGERLVNFTGGLEEVKNAQRRMLELIIDKRIR